MVKEKLIAKQDYVILLQTANKGLKKQLSKSVSGKNVRLVTIERSDTLHGRQVGGRIVSFIIGSDLEDPVRSAQRLHSIERNAKIILLAKSREMAELYKQTIRFSPLLGSNVSCIEESEMNTLVSMLLDSLRAGRYRALIEKTNSQISTIGTSEQQAYNHQFINKLMDIAPIGIAIVSREGIVLGWNREATVIFGRNEAQMLGNPLGELFERKERRNVERYIARTFNSPLDGGPVENLELRREPVGEAVQVLSCNAALFNKTGGTEEVVVLTIKDITGQKMAEIKLLDVNKTLAMQAKELAASNTELEQFAFVASHDLQEPLRMITSFLAHLERKYSDKLDNKGRQYIHFATDGAKRMRKIIQDLLEYSRVGRVEAEKEKVDINETLQVVKGLYSRVIREKNASVTWDEMPVIFASKGVIQQLFQNLISNALNYQEKGNRPEIHISWEDSPTHCTFFVKDNGIGIKPEYTEKIFNIFQRLHGREEYSGTGVGLAICKKIVEDHGGKIGVDSEEGKGSTFYFTIQKPGRHSTEQYL